MRRIGKKPEPMSVRVMSEYRVEATAAQLEEVLLRRTVATDEHGRRYISVAKLAADPKNGTIKKAVDLLRIAREEELEPMAAANLLSLMEIAIADLS